MFSEAIIHDSMLRLMLNRSSSKDELLYKAIHYQISRSKTRFLEESGFFGFQLSLKVYLWKYVK